MKILATTDPHRGFDHNTHRVHDKLFQEMKEAIEKESIDLVMIAGDIGTNLMWQFESFFAAYRKVLPNIATDVVCGNHDWWDRKWYKGKRRGAPSFKEMDDFHKEVATKYDIKLLQDNYHYFKEHDALIVGFDGWYQNCGEWSNDLCNMPRFHESAPIDTFMSWRAYNALSLALEYVEKTPATKKICMTHFRLNPESERDKMFSGNPRYFDEIINNFDLFIYGHSHRFEDKMYGKCRVVNPGNGSKRKQHGYNEPQIIVIEI